MSDYSIGIMEYRDIPGEPIRVILTKRVVINLLQGKVIISKGFDTDFASIRFRWLWPIIAPWGLHKQADVVHDWLYSGGLIHRADGTTYRPSRKECDQIYLELMKYLKVPWWKRQSMYWAVRAFGASRYVKSPKKYRK